MANTFLRFLQDDDRCFERHRRGDALHVYGDKRPHHQNVIHAHMAL